MGTGRQARRFSLRSSLPGQKERTVGPQWRLGLQGNETSPSAATSSRVMLPSRAARQGCLERTLAGVLPRALPPGSLAGRGPSAEGDSTAGFSQQEDPAFFYIFTFYFLQILQIFTISTFFSERARLTIEWFLKSFCLYVFIFYSWLGWVFVAAHGLSLAVARGGFRSLLPAWEAPLPSPFLCPRQRFGNPHPIHFCSQPSTYLIPLTVVSVSVSTFRNFFS